VSQSIRANVLPGATLAYLSKPNRIYAGASFRESFEVDLARSGSICVVHGSEFVGANASSTPDTEYKITSDEQVLLHTTSQIAFARQSQEPGNITVMVLLCGSRFSQIIQRLQEVLALSTTSLSICGLSFPNGVLMGYSSQDQQLLHELLTPLMDSLDKDLDNDFISSAFPTFK
jgi:urease accessory protein UreH